MTTFAKQKEVFMISTTIVEEISTQLSFVCLLLFTSCLPWRYSDKLRPRLTLPPTTRVFWSSAFSSPFYCPPPTAAYSSSSFQKSSPSNTPPPTLALSSETAAVRKKRRETKRSKKRRKKEEKEEIARVYACLHVPRYACLYA